MTSGDKLYYFCRTVAGCTGHHHLAQLVQQLHPYIDCWWHVANQCGWAKSSQWASQALQYAAVYKESLHVTISSDHYIKRWTQYRLNLQLATSTSSSVTNCGIWTYIMEHEDISQLCARTQAFFIQALLSVPRHNKANYISCNSITEMSIHATVPNAIPCKEYGQKEQCNGRSPMWTQVRLEVGRMWKLVRTQLALKRPLGCVEAPESIKMLQPTSCIAPVAAAIGASLQSSWSWTVIG